MKKLYFALSAMLAFASCQPGQQETTTAQAAAEPAIPYDSLKLVLEEVLATDQGIRERLSESTSPEEQMALMPEMQHIDSTNQLIVFQLIDKYGWLPQSEVGEDAASSIFYVVQHSSPSAMEKYFPLLQKRAQEGEASKIHAAMMEDRLLMWQGKKQIYGTQASNTGSEDGSMRIWPIEDPEHVNKRRAAVGMPLTIEENAARLGATYNPQATLPENY